MNLWYNYSVCFYVTGAIFEQGTDEVQSAFKYAITIHSKNVTVRKMEMQVYFDIINTADAFKLSRLSKYFNFIFNTVSHICLLANHMPPQLIK